MSSAAIKLLEAKVANQARELKIINERLGDAQRKLQLIEYSDYVKAELIPLSTNRSFKMTISDPSNDELSYRLFGATGERAVAIYTELNNKRNILCHRYSQTYWQKKTIPLHGKSFKQLLSSIRITDLLRTPRSPTLLQVVQ